MCMDHTASEVEPILSTLVEGNNKELAMVFHRLSHYEAQQINDSLEVALSFEFQLFPEIEDFFKEA